MSTIEDFMDNLKNSGGSKTHKTEQLGVLHAAFAECEKVYKSTLGSPLDDELAIVVGKVKGKDKFYLSLGGTETPLILEKTDYLYLIAGLSAIGEKVMEDNYSTKLSTEIKKGLKDGSCKPTVGVGETSGSMTSEDLKDFLSKADGIKDAQAIIDAANSGEEGTEPEEMDEEMSSEYETAKKEVEDFKEIYDSMSDEDKEALAKEADKKREELLYDKAKALEKDLMGELESEATIEYDYAYFKKIYTDKGPEFMREELAKIPKAERKDIITKIVAEVKKESDDKLAEE